MFLKSVYFKKLSVENYVKSDGENVLLESRIGIKKKKHSNISKMSKINVILPKKKKKTVRSIQISVC